MWLNKTTTEIKTAHFFRTLELTYLYWINADCFWICTMQPSDPHYVAVATKYISETSQHLSNKSMCILKKRCCFYFSSSQVRHGHSADPKLASVYPIKVCAFKKKLCCFYFSSSPILFVSNHLGISVSSVKTLFSFKKHSTPTAALLKSLLVSDISGKLC